MTRFTGKDLIEAGYEPGPHFGELLRVANALGRIDHKINALLLPPEPLRMKTMPANYNTFVDPGSRDSDEWNNLVAVHETMDVLMRTPGVVKGVILPDTCPAGPLGTIPVGGVVASENLHPGMHSADICCSVMLTEFFYQHPARVLAATHAATHFGPGGRDKFKVSEDLRRCIEENPFTKGLLDIADSHLGTQGDGNHFAFVGHRKSTGNVCLVTHHGSRGFGAKVYKRGMQVAEKFRRKLCPELPKMNAWIPADTQEGQDYWAALQLVRRWTRENHLLIHDAVPGYVRDRFWNEHNFVFQKSDGLFYHAKGATPAFPGWADDASDLTLVPLNMAEPVLLTRGLNNPAALGFSPHGAGRNYSRSEHVRRGVADLEEETKGLDVRFYSGVPDPSELPSAYKNAISVRRQTEGFGLAEVVDEVTPYGCIMAGDWQKDAPWRKKK